MDAPVLPEMLHLRPLFLYQFLHPLEFLLSDDGLVLPFHDDAVKLPVVLRPFLFQVVRHVFLPVFQLAAVEAVFQDMADGGVMPQALPHRREVAVFFKLPLDLLAAVARKVHIENLPDRSRLCFIDDVFRPHFVVAKHVPIVRTACRRATAWTRMRKEARVSPSQHLRFLHQRRVVLRLHRRELRRAVLLQKFLDLL